MDTSSGPTSPQSKRKSTLGLMYRGSERKHRNRRSAQTPHPVPNRDNSQASKTSCHSGLVLTASCRGNMQPKNSYPPLLPGTNIYPQPNKGNAITCQSCTISQTNQNPKCSGTFGTSLIPSFQASSGDSLAQIPQFSVLCCCYTASALLCVSVPSSQPSKL